MRMIHSTGAAGAILLALLLGLTAVEPAQAQIARTFVSAATGNDANDCGRNTPCRTFQRAHDNTLPLGEITVLDPGGYGAVSITKAMSIINDGVGEAGVLVSGGATAITINAAATDAVSLRGLTIKGIGFGGGTGIVFSTGGSLTIENCAIRTLDGVGQGITVKQNATSRLTVLNTIVADNSSHGIVIQPGGSSGAAITVNLSNVQLINNGQAGFLINAGLFTSTTTVDAVVTDSLASKNGAGGFVVSTGTPKASLMLIRSVAAHNSSAFGGISISGAGGIVRVGQSSLTGNQVSWRAVVSGVLRSYGDNNINGNADGDPAIPTVIPTK